MHPMRSRIKKEPRVHKGLPGLFVGHPPHKELTTEVECKQDLHDEEGLRGFQDHLRLIELNVNRNP